MATISEESVPMSKWVADQILINDLREENEALLMRCKTAEESLALYKPALRDANARFIEAMNELQSLKTGNDY